MEFITDDVLKMLMEVRIAKVLVSSMVRFFALMVIAVMVITSFFLTLLESVFYFRRFCSLRCDYIIRYHYTELVVLLVLVSFTQKK